MTDRLGPFLERLARLSVDDLSMLALPEPDPDERSALLARAAGAAADAGRRAELAEAPVRARDTVLHAFSFRAYDPTWFGLNWGRSLGRSVDRARLIAAVEDAAVAEVVADLLPTDDVAALREPFEAVAAMAGSAPAANPQFKSPSAEQAVAGAGILVSLAGLGAALIPFVVGFATLRRRRRPEAPDDAEDATGR